MPACRPIIRICQLVALPFMAVAIFFLCGCAEDSSALRKTVIGDIMECPGLYSAGMIPTPFADVPEFFCSNPAKVFYVTDRTPLPVGKNEMLSYGAQRSAHIEFGEAQIMIGADLNWKQLEAESCAAERKHALPLSICSITSILQTPDVPRPIYEKIMAKETGDPQAFEKAAKAMQDKFSAIIAERMSQVKRREAFVFIHGINTSFEQSLSDWTQVWHYLGRPGVPFVFSWPSGGGGLKTYFIDSDSGDASVEQLKKVIALLAKNSAVDKISIIGHSRGCDIISRTLLELAIANNAQGKPTGEGLKLNNILLIAPDVDANFFKLRVVENGVMSMPRQFTVYMSESDRAIGLSRWLRSGMNRLGLVNLNKVSQKNMEMVSYFPTVNMIVSKAKARSFSNHSYYLESPSVSSDLVLLLRYNFTAGTAGGRPLSPLADNI